MASAEEIAQCNGDIELTPEGLKKEMEECELVSAMSDDWQTPLEEVWTQPDLFRTSFLWQVQMEDHDLNLEDWEKEDDVWHYLPTMWQSILNNRLANFHSEIQDAEVVLAHRQEAFGEDDVKTKNAKKKLETLKAGEKAESIVLICKRTCKEASPEIYKKCISRSNTQGVKVAVSKQVDAFRLVLTNLTLEQLGQEGVVGTRQLRIVSLTGRSRQMQELRLHLNALSLSRSDVFENFAAKSESNKKKNLNAANAGGHEEEEEDAEMGEAEKSFSFPKRSFFEPHEFENR